MNEWIDVLIYGLLTLILWFALPAANSRFVLPIIEDRNPGWLREHGEAVRHLTRGRWLTWCGYVLGVLSFATLVSAQVGWWPRALSAPAFEPHHWMVLADIMTMQVFLWLLFSVTCGLIFNRWLKREVPLANHRRATLERRSIGNFVPRPLRAMVYAIVGLHLSAWVVVGALGAHSTPAFWGNVAFQFVIALAFLLIARFVAERRPNAMDRIFGPAFRRREVRFAFLAQLLPLLNGGARLYEEVTGTSALGVDRPFRLALVAFMIAGVMLGFFRFTWSAPSKLSGTPAPAQSPRPRP